MVHKISSCSIILSFIFCFFLCNILVGQNRDVAVVHVIDGSIYRGEIINEDEHAIYMVLNTGDPIRISKAMVRKKMKGDEYLFYNKGRYHDTKGFFWSIGLGFNPVGTEDNNSQAEHFEILLGYRFHKDLSVAFGFGSEFNTTDVGGFPVETSFSSYFLYGRYYLADWRRRPYIYVRPGYGTGPEDEFESGRHSGGLQFQAGIGLHFASKKKSKFNLSLGYHFQKTNGTQFYLDPLGNELIVDYKILIHQPVLKFIAEFR